ncbi:hypothetical protein H5410_041438, partial [Solanum commersonii]
ENIGKLDRETGFLGCDGLRDKLNCRTIVGVNSLSSNLPRIDSVSLEHRVAALSTASTLAHSLSRAECVGEGLGFTLPR